MTVVSLSCDDTFGDGRIRIGRPDFFFMRMMQKYRCFGYLFEVNRYFCIYIYIIRKFVCRTV